MSDEFNIGDVVRLKSGGPDMTINGEVQGTTHLTYSCQWFDADEKSQNGQFQAASLEPPSSGPFRIEVGRA